MMWLLIALGVALLGYTLWRLSEPWRERVPNTAADEPRKQDGQAFQLYPAKKYCGETKTGHCEGSQTGRCGCRCGAR